MADEIKTDIIALAASPVAPSAEAVASPAPVIAEVTPAPAVETPIVEAPVTEAAPVAEVKKVETLLSETKKAEEAKPADAEVAPVAEAPVVEEKAPEAPKYEITMPEGSVADPVKFSEFTNALSEFELKSKVAHEDVQALGQQFLNRHIDEMKRYTESLTTAWNKQKNDWQQSFLKDPEFANRTDTVIRSALDVIDTYAGTPAQTKELYELLHSTGVGNHPAVIRLLSNIKIAKPEPKQLAAPQIASPVKASKISKMYGNKTGK